VDKKQVLAATLKRINVIKFGEFTLKGGAVSSVYVDLRSIVAYPQILRMVADALWDCIKGLHPNLLCGVPYTALPIATCIALDQNVPMLLCRKERKDYGTQKQVDGIFSKGNNCLIIEDVITTAGSVLDTIAILLQQGLQVTDVVALVDRQQGGRELLEKGSYRLHSVFTLAELM